MVEFCAGVEVVPDCVDKGRDWVSSVLGLRLCLCIDVGAAAKVGYFCTMIDTNGIAPNGD